MCWPHVGVDERVGTVKMEQCLKMSQISLFPSKYEFQNCRPHNVDPIRLSNKSNKHDSHDTLNGSKSELVVLTG